MKKLRNLYLIIFGLIIFISALFIKNYKLSQEIYNTKSKVVYELKNNIIYLLENKNSPKEIETFIKRKIHINLNFISPEIESNEVRDKWTSYVYSIENIDYANINENKSKNFIAKYLDNISSICPIYNKTSTYEDITLEEFLQDVQDLKS